MADRLEIRADGLYTIRDIFGKPLERKAAGGWHVLFVSDIPNEFPKRLGFVVSINPETQQIVVMDDVVYPHAPSPISAPTETISFQQVLEAGSGFYRLRRKVHTDKGASVREVHVLNDRASEVGFVVSKSGIRLYVKFQDGRWEVC